MRSEPNLDATFGGGRPVYTRNDALLLQGLPEFSRGLIQWRQGAVTRTPDGRLTFHRNRATRQGPNLFQDQPIETLYTIIDTLPTTEENMRLLLQWKQVNRSWYKCIDSHSGPNDQWQRSLRGDLRAGWQTLYRRAIAVVCENRDPRPLPQQEETRILLDDLYTTLKTHSYSRASTGGVAVIILILTRPNANFTETLGGYPPPTIFNRERLLLQSLLSAGILRHGLAPTPWHSSRTGPRYTPHDAPDDSYFDVLRSGEGKKWRRVSDARGNILYNRRPPQASVYAVELDTDDHLTLRGGLQAATFGNCLIVEPRRQGYTQDFRFNLEQALRNKNLLTTHIIEWHHAGIGHREDGSLILDTDRIKPPQKTDRK